MTKEELERVNLLLKCAKLESALRITTEALKAHIDVLADICKETNNDDYGAFIGATYSVLNDAERFLKA